MACCCSIISEPITCMACGLSMGFNPERTAVTGFGSLPLVTITSLRISPFLFFTVSFTVGEVFSAVVYSWL
ncbi:hypothetical protein D3C86_903050 [compost metagenome]